METAESSVYIGTVSYLLSHRSYLDFVRDGLNVNQLPLLTGAVSSLQRALDDIHSETYSHPGGSIVRETSPSRSLERYASEDPFLIEFGGFHVEAISLENGSVYAKIKIAANIGLAAYGFVAAYPDFKEGFPLIRNDIIVLVNKAFNVVGAGPVDLPADPGQAELHYYFVQPRRIEEEILKILGRAKENRPKEGRSR